MTNQELYQKKQLLESYLGQLIDLEKGFIKEIMLTADNAKTILLLKECVNMAIARINEHLSEQNQAKNYPLKETI